MPNELCLQGLDAADLASGKQRRATVASTTVLRGNETSGGLQTSVLGSSFDRERPQTVALELEKQEYIEKEVARRMGREVDDAVPSVGMSAGKSIEELALESVAPKQRIEAPEDLGAAFVAGVAEVELDIEQKLKSIESTEAAKAALLDQRRGAAVGPSHGNVPSEDDAYFMPGTYDARKNVSRAQFPARFGKPRPHSGQGNASKQWRKR